MFSCRMVSPAMVKSGLLLIILVVSAVHGKKHRGSLTREMEELSANYDTLLAKVTSLQARIDQLEADRPRRVAFTAFITAGSRIAASNNAIIHFRSVITNIGNAYNPHTAAFTAPYDGDYFFAVNVDVSRDYEVVSLRRNNRAVVMADADDSVSTHRTTSAVVSLRARDVVTVNQERADAGSIDTGNDCVFTGFFLS